MTKIHILWDGPHSFEDATRLDGEQDYGVYQIYGCHTVYGSDALLYIGKAVKQTFGKRIKEEKEPWKYNWDARRIAVYVGRVITDSLSTVKTHEQWADWVGAAEELLIYAHAPACNSKNIQSINYKLLPFHVLNWGSFRDLLPEVSGHRWTYKNDVGDWETITPHTLAR